MATNDFIGFASNGSANVMSQADYAAAAEQGDGVQPGMASSKLANKAWRQGANMAAALGEMIKAQGIDALDNGDIATLSNNIVSALSAFLLSLSGGAMSGNITRSSQDGLFYLSGGMGWDLAENGARLALYGKDEAMFPGGFRLSAGSSVGTPELVGTPNGTLKWDGSNVVTLAQYELSSQVSTTPRTFKTKLPNGVMIQCRYDSFTTDNNSRVQWTFPEAFIESPFVFALKSSNAQDVNLYYWGATSLQLRCNDMTGAMIGSGKTVPLMLLAIGRWK